MEENKTTEVEVKEVKEVKNEPKSNKETKKPPRCEKCTEFREVCGEYKILMETTQKQLSKAMSIIASLICYVKRNAWGPASLEQQKIRCEAEDIERRKRFLSRKLREKEIVVKETKDGVSGNE